MQRGGKRGSKRGGKRGGKREIKGVCWKGRCFREVFSKIIIFYIFKRIISAVLILLFLLFHGIAWLFL
jgi:hypothetical protein